MSHKLRDNNDGTKKGVVGWGQKGRLAAAVLSSFVQRCWKGGSIDWILGGGERGIIAGRYFSHQRTAGLY